MPIGQLSLKVPISVAAVCFVSPLVNIIQQMETETMRISTLNINIVVALGILFLYFTYTIFIPNSTVHTVSESMGFSPKRHGHTNMHRTLNLVSNKGCLMLSKQLFPNNVLIHMNAPPLYLFGHFGYCPNIELNQKHLF